MMKKNKLKNAKTAAISLASIIQIPLNWLPIFEKSNKEGLHLYIDDKEVFHYVNIERGIEGESKSSLNLDDILFWIFSDITFKIACKFELNNRIPTQDVRRIIFKKQKELMRFLNESWIEKIEREHESITELNPFDDFTINRANFYEELALKGIDSDEAWERTCKEFPLPLK